MTTAPNRPSGREEIQDAVLDAAARLLATTSPNEVSVRAIAREADITYSLVNRHFGTKDDLFEQLLERYSQQWEPLLDADVPLGEQLGRLLGDRPDAGAYLRLVAWQLLSTDPDRAAAAFRTHSRLDRLVADDADGVEGVDEIALALAHIFGWRFFGPFIAAALDLGPDDMARLQASMRRRMGG